MSWDVAFALFALPLLASYVGYPAVLWLLIRVRRLAGEDTPEHVAGGPATVSVIVAAHNESLVIEQKIRNFLALDYPASALDLTIVSDGSSDRTCELARALVAEQSPEDQGRIRILERTERSGKTVAISAAVPDAPGEIIVFSDANTMFRPDALAALVAPLASPDVGLACGHLSYVVEDRATSTGEIFYWRYENLLKALEGALGELLVANGSIYALRKELFEPVPAPVADDMVVPIRISMRGFARVYVDDAVAEERLPTEASEEFRAKARIVAQGFEALRALRPELMRSRPLLLAQVLLHKVIRWFAAPLMMLLLLTSMLGTSRFLGWMLGAQLVFYALVPLAALLRNRAPSLVLLPFYFTMVNFAALKGFWDFLRGRSHATWEKSATTRVAHADEELKILFLSHYFPPESNAPATRVHETCRCWAQAGHRVQVITCAPNVPDGKVYEGYRNRWLHREVVDGIEVLRVWSILTPNEGLARTVMFISFMLTATLRALLVERPDVIVATSPQFFCGWAGVLTKWLRRRPLILEIRDPWPEAVVAVGVIQNPTLISTLEWLEKRMYSAADHIVTVGEGCVEIITAKGVPPEKITLITHGVDRSLFRPQPPDQDLIRRLELEGKFVCSFVGTIGLSCGLDIVLRAARSLQEKGIDDVVFLLVGDGATRDELESQARSQGLDELVFMGRQDKSKIPAIMSVSDCCLVHMIGADWFQKVVPSKTAEAMSMARPIIMGGGPAAARVIEESGGGISIERENDAELVEALLQLRQDPALCERLGQNGARYAEIHHDRTMLATRYLELVRRMSPTTEQNSSQDLGVA